MDDYEYVTYEHFGRRFFEVAVTEQRVAAAVAAVAGNEFEIGPMRQGPGKLAKITARVLIERPQVERTIGETLSFDIRIPLAIGLTVDLRLDKQEFKVAGEIELRAWARAAEPLLLVIDIAKPRASDITVNVMPSSLRGEVLRVIGGVDAEIRRFTAKHVAGEIDSSASRRARIIDVAERLDSAWTGV